MLKNVALRFYLNPTRTNRKSNMSFEAMVVSEHGCSVVSGKETVLSSSFQNCWPDFTKLCPAITRRIRTSANTRCITIRTIYGWRRSLRGAISCKHLTVISIAHPISPRGRCAVLFWQACVWYIPRLLQSAVEWVESRWETPVASISLTDWFNSHISRPQKSASPWWEKGKNRSETKSGS